MLPSLPNNSTSCFRLYFGLSKVGPSNSFTLTPLIQVVIVGGLPTHRTLAVFHSHSFQALTQSDPETENAFGGCVSVGLVVIPTSFLSPA